MLYGDITLLHITQYHPQADLQQYLTLCEITQEERYSMREKYNAKPRDAGKKRAKDAPSHALTISEDHTSYIVIQYVKSVDSDNIVGTS